MQIFLDSVNINAIEHYAQLNMIDGITTNPSLVSKSEIDFTTLARKICSLIKGDVSLEVSGNSYDEMIKEGEHLASIAENVVVKLPMTEDGIRACTYFSNKAVKVNMTLCFSSAQALIAARSGAYYISPFIGRLEDIGCNGMNLIQDILKIYQNYNYKTKVLAASIRNINHIEQVAIVGAACVTIPEKFMQEILKHKLTDEGLIKFNEDWLKSGQKII